MKKRFSAKVLVVAIIVALLGSMLIGPVASSATEPTNLVPADLFASPEKAAQWFDRASSDAADYTMDGSDYVMHVKTVNSAWTYSNQAISMENYTIRMYVKSIVYYSESKGIDVNGGMGIVLGTGSGNGFPWVDTRIDFNTDGNELVDYYIWEHHGSVNGMVNHFGGEWYDDYGMPEEDAWMEVIYEVTPTKTTMYVDGFQVPDMEDVAEDARWADITMGHLPTSSELKWIGFFSEGGTEGFYVKNLGIYEGVGLFTNDEEEEEPTEEPVDDPTEAPVEDDPTEAPVEDDPTEAPTEAPTEEPVKDTKDGGNAGLIIGIVIAVVVVAAGAVVAIILIKKKK